MGDPGALEGLIPKTQEVLQPLIAKPKLADKLLAKPPFRFLHDIFSALTQATGFAKGLYNDFEIDSANIKEKNQKIAYLDKMIVCVGFCLGRDVDVRSAKIVAGLEPENTNIFLQDLAAAASNASLDWAKAVQRALDKVPTLTPDGGVAVPATAAEAKQPAEAGGSRPGSKEKSGSADPDKAAAAAAAEAKAKERARRERDDAEKKEREQRAEVQRRENEDLRAKAESKAEAAAAAATAVSNRRQPDNNELDDGVLQQIRECNGDFERTKDVVEKIIAKPKMAVKLLSKPPFRFIHDIVSEVTRVTGFAEGLYNADELDSNNIKEKQPKIDYLTKIIQCVSCHLNVEIEAKPAKIVAGLEPEETNKFLQLLAVGCRHGSSADAVQRVLAGDTALRASSAGVKKPSSAATASKQQLEREATPEAKLSSRSTTPQESKARPSVSEGKDLAPTSSSAAGAGSFSGPMKALKSQEDDDDGNANLRFQSAQDAKDGSDNADDAGLLAAPGTSGGFGTSRTSRPTTARRRPPKLKENVTEVGRLLVPDAKVAPVVGIMKDGDNADSDDDGGDDNNQQSHSAPGSASRTLDEGSGGGAHGRLVRDLLKDEAAARKQKEDDEAKEAAGGPTLEAETGIRLGRRKKSFKDKSKAGASSAAEMNELRASIQKICQATLPMGKSIEFVHEDLDAMSKELDKWKKEYDKKCGVFEEERKRTDDALQPLQLQLLEVEEQIKEQVHKINTLKATIAKNEEKTQRLLRMVVSA